MKAAAGHQDSKRLHEQPAPPEEYSGGRMTQGTCVAKLPVEWPWRPQSHQAAMQGSKADNTEGGRGNAAPRGGSNVRTVPFGPRKDEIGARVKKE